ncbi:hypothetical protein RSOLAG1IB_10022 [Rhizoctonia solani AG-1 IB]|uniref:Zn(2)-C6 fungal-type domain-containing protein n=1 Tax=Thanatephorus cucumeris (strain AG1-IB / isolate 7/3/14) TaxID=1108050 RepID=A0A0B7FUN5_THACB|nr:hypothetical protein RSOLAG1IB_10022 [Rhizoctonia solani AG-1 IB]
MHSYGQAEAESFAGIDPGTTGNFVPKSPQRLADRVSQGTQCDRCYASEARCVYEQSSNACTRCQRLRINCTSARSKSKSKTIHTNEWSENTLSLIPRPSGNTLSAYQTLSSWIPWNYDLTQIVTEGHQGTGDQLKARLRELAGKRNAIPAEPAWENRPLRRLVACIRCRKYRSKCIRDVPGTNVCQRCRESRSECRYTPLNRGKVPSSSTSRNLPGLRISSVITDEDAENLFTIFREKMNGGIMIFDDTIHTPAVLKSRCPALFTTICAVVSHYWHSILG